MNLFAPRKICTVSEITAQVKLLLEGSFSDVMVEGEISNFTAASSGHLYFLLKDKGAQLKCACFRQRARLLRFKPEDGLSVIASGHIGVYEPRGEYQLYVESLEPKGIGSLQLAFEQLKTKLQTEGLFDAARKKPLPLLPRKIGIVTSPTGAAIHDILRILGRRHHSLKILIYPSKVQGEGAAKEIAGGIAFLNTLSDIDVMIVGRGGGSAEDLWAFNEEEVARAIAASRIPVISAVGHEIDFTIADFVADLRAPTPSAAAEMVVGQKREFTDQIARLEQRMAQSLQYQINRWRNRILILSSDRGFASVEGRLRFFQQRADELALRLQSGMEDRLSVLRHRWQLSSSSLERHDPLRLVRMRRETLRAHQAQLGHCIQLLLQGLRSKTQALEAALEALSPMAVLQRGYAICRDAQGNILKSSHTLQVGDPFSVVLAQGTIEGKAEKID